LWKADEIYAKAGGALENSRENKVANARTLACGAMCPQIVASVPEIGAVFGVVGE
jgi:hypothetical protein